MRSRFINNCFYICSTIRLINDGQLILFSKSSPNFERKTSENDVNANHSDCTTVKQILRSLKFKAWEEEKLCWTVHIISSNCCFWWWCSHSIEQQVGNGKILSFCVIKLSLIATTEKQGNTRILSTKFNCVSIDNR